MSEKNKKKKKKQGKTIKSSSNGQKPVSLTEKSLTIAKGIGHYSVPSNSNKRAIIQPLDE